MGFSKAQTQELLAALAAMLAGGPAATAAPQPRKSSKSRKVAAGDPAATFTVEPGTREGYVQLRFTAKPSAAVIADLKKRHFAWSPRNQVWYGDPANVPMGRRA